MTKSTYDTDDPMITQLHELRLETAPESIFAGVMTRTGLADTYLVLDSAIGKVYVAHNPRGISAVMRAGSDAEFEESFSRRFGRRVYRSQGTSTAIEQKVMDALTGRKAKLDFDLSGLSEFEVAVLRKAMEIPRGEVRPYAWVAREIGKPGAVRAVGNALGHNPIPLLIPCHRVVKSDGTVGKYALGGEAKQTVLSSEGVVLGDLQQLSRSGVRFIGSDTTGVYCFPTCSNARRVTEQHKMLFATEAEARDLGYRPCKVCRPAVSA